MSADGNVIQRAGQWIRETVASATRPVREMIGRISLGTSNARMKTYKTFDETVPDYEFWDKFRRGKATGYSLGSLFVKPIERIFSHWVFGKGLDVKLAQRPEIEYEEDAKKYTEAKLSAFVTRLLDSGQAGNEELDDRDEGSTSMLMQLYQDHMGLGDQYVVVNADGSLSIASPDTVTVERDELDYRQVEAVEIEARTGEYTITDRYEADERTVTIMKGAQQQSEETYANLLGVIPVVHLAQGRSANETNGHPIHEALLPLYDQYDDLIYKQLGGAKKIGNPFLTFAGMSNIDEVKDANAPQEYDTYTDKDGNKVMREQMIVDQDSVMLIGEGGDAKYVAPPTGFTGDTTEALRNLFLMLLYHTGIPEFIWGNELSSARATSETQMDHWIHDIQGLQRLAGGWILRLCALWLRTQALTDSRLIVGPLGLDWAPLREQDATLRLEQVELGRKEHLLTDEMALRLLDLVEDPAAETEAAHEEFMNLQDELFPGGDTWDFRNDLRQAEREAEED